MPQIVIQERRDSRICSSDRPFGAKLNRLAKRAISAELVEKVSHNEKHSSKLFSIKST
jgi:hypothetical protein